MASTTSEDRANRRRWLALYVLARWGVVLVVLRPQPGANAARARAANALQVSAE